MRRQLSNRAGVCVCIRACTRACGVVPLPPGISVLIKPLVFSSTGKLDIDLTIVPTLPVSCGSVVPCSIDLVVVALPLHKLQKAVAPVWYDKAAIFFFLIQNM